MKSKEITKLGFRGSTLWVLLTSLLFLFPSPVAAQDIEVFTKLGLYGGQLYDIAIDPSNPDKMFVGSYLGDGMYVSTNGAGSWQPVETNGEVPGEDDFKNQASWAVKLAPGDPHIIWVAHNYWVEKSEDGGQTWTHILNGDMQKRCKNCGACESTEAPWPDCEWFRLCKTVAINPNDAQTVYVGTSGRWTNYDTTEGAIFKTTDGGGSWEKMNGGNNFDHNVYEIQIDPQNSNILWAVTTPWDSTSSAGTLYRSENGGNTWTEIYSLTDYHGPEDGEAFSAVAVKPNDSNVVFTGSGIGVIKHYFENNQWNASFDIIGESFQVEDIVFDPQSAETLYATWGSDDIGYVARSGDGGTTWEIYEHEYDFWSLEVHPRNREIIFASDINLGLFKSVDHGQTWQPVNEGIANVIVNDVAVDPNDSQHILTGTISGIYEKTATEDWNRILTKITNAVQFHPTNSQVFFAGLEGVLARTLDGGQTWSFSHTIDDGNNHVSDIAIDPIDTSILYISIAGRGNYGKIYKSEDEGASVYEVLDGENLSGEKYNFNAVAISPNDNSHVFAGGGNFEGSKRLGDLWESTDGGRTWARTSLSDVIVNALIINPLNPQVLYLGAGYSGGTEMPLYKSIDGGVTWSASFEGLPGGPEISTPWNSVTDLDFHRHNKNIVYASTLRQGVYLSPNQGSRWLNLGTPAHDVNAIAAGSLFGATDGGLFQLTGTGVIAGRLTDDVNQSDIDGATVFTDTGGQSLSINGEYMMVVPAALCSVTTIADDHATHTEEGVVVTGGDVTWVDLPMARGISDTSIGTEASIRRTSGGGGGCALAGESSGKVNSFVLLLPVLLLAGARNVKRRMKSHST